MGVCSPHSSQTALDGLQENMLYVIIQQEKYSLNADSSTGCKLQNTTEQAKVAAFVLSTGYLASTLAEKQSEKTNC